MEPSFTEGRRVYWPYGFYTIIANANVTPRRILVGRRPIVGHWVSSMYEAYSQTLRNIDESNLKRVLLLSAVQH